MLERCMGPGIVVHTFNASIQEAEIVLCEFGPACSTYIVPGSPELDERALKEKQ